MKIEWSPGLKMLLMEMRLFLKEIVIKKPAWSIIRDHFKSNTEIALVFR